MTNRETVEGALREIAEIATRHVRLAADGEVLEAARRARAPWAAAVLETVFLGSRGRTALLRPAVSIRPDAPSASPLEASLMAPLERIAGAPRGCPLLDHRDLRIAVHVFAPLASGEPRLDLRIEGFDAHPSQRSARQAADEVLRLARDLSRAARDGLVEAGPIRCDWSFAGRRVPAQGLRGALLKRAALLAAERPHDRADIRGALMRDLKMLPTPASRRVGPDEIGEAMRAIGRRAAAARRGPSEVPSVDLEAVKDLLTGIDREARAIDPMTRAWPNEGSPRLPGPILAASALQGDPDASIHASFALRSDDAHTRLAWFGARHRIARASLRLVGHLASAPGLDHGRLRVDLTVDQPLGDRPRLAIELDGYPASSRAVVMATAMRDLRTVLRRLAILCPREDSSIEFRNWTVAGQRIRARTAEEAIARHAALVRREWREGLVPPRVEEEIETHEMRRTVRDLIAATV